MDVSLPDLRQSYTQEPRNRRSVERLRQSSFRWFNAHRIKLIRVQEGRALKLDTGLAHASLDAKCSKEPLCGLRRYTQPDKHGGKAKTARRYFEPKVTA
jgi:hypothetical protein